MITAARLPLNSGIRTVFDRAEQLEREGRSVMHLEVGRPDWRLAPGAADAAIDALRGGEVHYIANRGLRSLREALADDVAGETGRSFDPDRELIVTTGASEALSIAMLALLERGDEVVVPQPAWNHYVAAVELAGGSPVTLALREGDGWAIDPDRLSALISPRTRMIVINSPSNPTGAVQTPDVLEAVADIALHNNLYVLTDEIYRHFVYGRRHVSIARYLGESDLLLYMNSASKSFGMSGWRVGWVAAAAPVSDALNRAHQYITVCGVPFLQRGLLASLTDPRLPGYLQAMRVEFHARAEVWSRALTGVAGVDLANPSGAFYLFPRIRFRDLDDCALCAYMLDEHGLAMVPGTVFGAGCEGYVRISYGLSMETQHAAAKRLAEVLHAG